MINNNGNTSELEIDNYDFDQFPSIKKVSLKHKENVAYGTSPNSQGKAQSQIKRKSLEVHQQILNVAEMPRRKASMDLTSLYSRRESNDSNSTLRTDYGPKSSNTTFPYDQSSYSNSLPSSSSFASYRPSSYNQRYPPRQQAFGEFNGNQPPMSVSRSPPGSKKRVILPSILLLIYFRYCFHGAGLRSCQTRS